MFSESDKPSCYPHKDHLKKEFGKRNSQAINYIFDYYDPDKKATVLANIISAISEHVIAESLGIQQTAGVWKNGSLYFGDYNIENALDEGVENTYKQIPDFEILRNIENLNFYSKLKKHRSLGGRETFVEFSPSPPNFSDPEVAKRGYKGYDTIVFYEANGNGTEKITQHWFPAVGFEAYTDLFHRLGIALESNQSPDLDVMKHAGNFSNANVLAVDSFIQQHQERLRNPEIQNQLHDFLKSLEPSILNYLNSIDLEASSITEIEQILIELERMMTEYQLQMRLLLLEVFSINTLTESQRYNYNLLLQNNPNQQLTAEELGYTLSGCGFGPYVINNQPVLAFNPSILFGKTSVLANSFLNFNELYVFICPNCSKWHAIDVPNNIFIEKCSCGFDAKCNRTNKEEPFGLANVA